jgi:predicted Rossmann fold nucleotide-binding protein DprA/Smf involved in DNA uptake
VPSVVSRDTQATLLLVARLGNKPSVPPLNRGEYISLAQTLHQSGLRPGDLLNPGALDRLQLNGTSVTRERLGVLLDRGGGLALTLESWVNMGIWVVSRADPDYPQAIKARLRAAAPPVFFGVGPLDALQGNSIGVVGSRDVTESGTDFARELGRLCARQSLQVVSGAARGTDLEAMFAAIDAGGVAIGVLAGDLERLALSRRMREPIRDGSLTLISPFEPTAHFTVGYAMERNRYIYTLSRFVVVVAAAAGEGGTWAGAVENLDAGWVPLVVRADPDAPEGNRGLLQSGATAVLSEDLRAGVNLRTLCRDAAVASAVANKTSTDQDRPLELPLDQGIPDDGARTASPESAAGSAAAVSRQKPHSTLFASDVDTSATGPAASSVARTDAEDEASSAATVATKPVPPSVPPSTAVEQRLAVFDLVWPHLRTFLATPRTFAEIEGQFSDVLASQLKAWLSRAMADGSVTKKGRPVRFVRSSQVEARPGSGAR